MLDSGAPESQSGGGVEVSFKDYSDVLAKIQKRLAKDTAKIDGLEAKVDGAEEENEVLSAKYKAIFTAKVKRGTAAIPPLPPRRLLTPSPVTQDQGASRAHQDSMERVVRQVLCPPPPIWRCRVDNLCV